jgi:hypothetical protein
VRIHCSDHYKASISANVGDIRVTEALAIAINAWH